MREPLRLFQRRFIDQKLPLPIVKTYLLMLLAGLDYLHSECRVVHTGRSPCSILSLLWTPDTELIFADLKLENILVTFENQTVISDFIKAQTDLPMQHKVDSTGRTVYRCHNDFGPLMELKNLPRIVDFGLASWLGLMTRKTSAFIPYSQITIALQRSSSVAFGHLARIYGILVS
jgi:serine/threonine protein kinase